MKGNGIKDWWGGLSSNQKFFMILLILVILYFVYRSFRGAIEGAGATAQAGGTLAVLSAQGIKPSYDSATYQKFADRLEYSMDGAGTYEDIIYNVYRYMHNDADVTKLNQSFGIRQDKTLNEWIQGDLDSESISKINASLKDKGITKIIK